MKIVLKSLSFKGDLPTNKPDLKANVEIVRKTAAEGMILLKNEKTLPIQNNVKLALFGKNASNYVTGGGGSSEVNAAYRVQLLEGLTNENYKVIDSKDGKKFEEGMNSKDVDYAVKESDVAIVSIGRSSTEGTDNYTMETTSEETTLIKMVADK